MRNRILTTLVAMSTFLFVGACSQQNAGTHSNVASANSKVDPICNMSVEPEKAAAKFEHQGETYHFCSEHCKEEFSKEPEKYLSGK